MNFRQKMTVFKGFYEQIFEEDDKEEQFLEVRDFYSRNIF